MAFSAYIIARVAASANIEDGEDMEEDEDKENRVPEGGQNGEIGDTSFEVPMHGEEHGGDVHTEEDLAAIAEHFNNQRTDHVYPNFRVYQDENDENIPPERDETHNQERGRDREFPTDGVRETRPLVYPYTGVYDEFWVSEWLARAERFEFHSSQS
ncbi:hypothetical protein GLOTRDRAFT_129391 [Gloeophyllum trabeum ATCC 11539]|uniref:Uncharacterized protein n=1 Tax=Gloeophyllum trabeum (strain ATCC 11539 / FP-39264 / Madison 617) TaxID=670483 RepID=S7RL55_GLOTA|nr:uncharacterized protein GLOTRDRAFT_129391 [Gloeophyllum trabeum ATCC 11539]EPQ55100.1 hypothetical protein GLOTRDRAFT_129391 [Gloeophyllum trabeum ATCC 11539]